MRITCVINGDGDLFWVHPTSRDGRLPYFRLPDRLQECLGAYARFAKFDLCLRDDDSVTVAAPGGETEVLSEDAATLVRSFADSCPQAINNS